MRAKRCSALFILGASFVVQAQQDTVSVASIEKLIRTQQFDQALDSIKSGLHNSPKDFRLWTLDGIVLSIKGSDQDAISAFQRALSISPNYPAALEGEVQLLYKAQDVGAIPLLEKILKADPKNETAHEMIANLERRQGNCLAAIDHFLLTSESTATHPDSLKAYAYCLVQTKQPERAISVFEQLSALLPKSFYPRFDLAVLLVETKQYETALKVIEPLMATDESDAELLSLASEAYEAVGNTPKAVSLLRQAIILSPANANYYNAFVLICFDHESFQVGIDMLDAGLKRVQDDPSLYTSRGLLYVQLSEFDKAENDFNTAERLDSKQGLSGYAKTLEELQKNLSGMNPSDNVLTEIRSQLKSHPDNPLLYCLLAKVLTSEGSESDSNVPDEAIRSALMAVKLKPDLVDARDILANIYTRTGQYDLAIEQSRLALQYSPSDRIAIYHLILALRHSGHKEQRDEIQALVKRLADLQQSARELETEKKRYKLVEEQPEQLK
jgi:tetratricopeptide (TPR) repeat protein